MRRWIAMAAMVAALTAVLGGCTNQELPQSQAQQADDQDTGPIFNVQGQLTVYWHSARPVDAMLAAVDGPPRVVDARAAELPAGQDADGKERPAITGGFVFYTGGDNRQQADASNAGTTDQGQSASGGSPGPIDQSPTLQGQIPVVVQSPSGQASTAPQAAQPANKEPTTQPDN